MKFDMHCHTKEGSIDAKLPVEEYIQILISKGFDGMMISDHDSYSGYEYYKKMGLDEKYPDFTVIKGVEYDTLDAGHILCILPNHISLKILEIKAWTNSTACSHQHKRFVSFSYRINMHLVSVNIDHLTRRSENVFLPFQQDSVSYERKQQKNYMPLH